MINLHTSNVEVEHLKRMIIKKLEHSYLDKYIKKPAIDQYKLTILYHTVDQTNLSESQKENYIITTMSVQTALDTHELVPILTQTNESNDTKTSRQLQVLAGDYFSSLYYLLLSETEEIKLIQTFATAVKEINELKMKRYYKEVNSFEEFVAIEQKIDSLLFTQLAEFLNVSFITMINESLIITNKLVREKINYYKKGKLPFVKKWAASTNPNTTTVMLEKLDSIIRKKLHIIHKEIPSLPTTLQKDIQLVTNELEQKNNSMVGELNNE